MNVVTRANLQTFLPLREGARLQSFPDWFELGEQQMAAYLRLTGNSVPPKLTELLAFALLSGR